MVGLPKGKSLVRRPNQPVLQPFKPDGGLLAAKAHWACCFLWKHRHADSPLSIKAAQRGVFFKDQYALDKAFNDGDLNKNCACCCSIPGPVAMYASEFYTVNSNTRCVTRPMDFQKVALVTDDVCSVLAGNIPARFLTPWSPIRKWLIAKWKDMVRVIEIKYGNQASHIHSWRSWIYASREILAKVDLTDSHIQVMG